MNDILKEGCIANEEEYFFKIDRDLLKKKRMELDACRAEQTAKERQEHHWMKCPKCGNTLEEIDHQSVMLDRCVGCDGIWLDKGELELLADGNAKISQGFLLRFFAR